MSQPPRRSPIYTRSRANQNPANNETMAEQNPPAPQVPDQGQGAAAAAVPQAQAPPQGQAQAPPAVVVPPPPANQWQFALRRCGLSDATIQHFVGEGFESIQALASLPVSETQEMLKIFGRKTLPAGVSYPYMACLRLRALRYWIEYRRGRGETLNPDHFIGQDLINAWVTRVTELADLKDSDKSDDNKAPSELAKLTEWETFEEQFLSYLGRHRNEATGAPLSYVLRETATVSDETLYAAYLSIDDDLYETTVMTTPQYIKDNKRVFALLKPLLLKGFAWSYAKKFNKTQDGRAAWIAVKQQAEGTAAQAAKRAAARKSIADSRYTGKGRHTFDAYTTKHQMAHNTLEELKEPVYDEKKVTDFLSNITDPLLSSAKDAVLGDPVKSQNFEACQQYLKSVLLLKKSTSTEVEKRSLGSMNQKRTNKHNKGKGKSQKGKRKDAPRIHGGHHDKEKWESLTPDERAKCLELRHKRKAEAMESGTESETPDPWLAFLRTQQATLKDLHDTYRSSAYPTSTAAGREVSALYTKRCVEAGINKVSALYKEPPGNLPQNRKAKKLRLEESTKSDSENRPYYDHDMIKSLFDAVATGKAPKAPLAEDMKPAAKESEDSKDKGLDESDTTEGAGSQFGPFAHKKQQPTKKADA